MPFGEDIFQNVGARTASLSYSTSQDDIRQKFTGYQKDSETQLDFAEARMYENRFGRFTAVDPLLSSGRSANPQTFNRYGYTSNNPVIRVDVDGLDWVKIKNVRVTYGRTYVTWQPVWKDNAAGSTAWEKGVYRIQHGKDRGKWAALDPYNDRWTLADTRAGAVAAYESYKSQMQVDATAGGVQPLTDTINVAEALSTRGSSLGNIGDGLGTKIRNGLFGVFGATPDENSGPFRSASNLSNVLTTVSGGVSGLAGGGGLLSGLSRGRFSVASSKFDYFFGRVVSGPTHNIARSAQNLDDLTTLGITSESQLMDVFSQAIESGTEVSTSTGQFGTTVMRRVNIGEGGAIEVGFFYLNGDLDAIPKVTTIIPKIFK